VSVDDDSIFLCALCFPRKKFRHSMFADLLLLIFEEDSAVARRCDCDGRVNEHEFDIWLLLFGIRTKWNEHGSGAVFAGDADSDRGSLRILFVADRSVDPHG
jgi:hypothetical protein